MVTEELTAVRIGTMNVWPNNLRLRLATSITPESFSMILWLSSWIQLELYQTCPTQTGTEMNHRRRRPRRQ